MAAADEFEITVIGAGGHAARPQAANDPIVLAAHAVHAIHHIVSRRLDPLEPGVITIGQIHGGTVNNVIPDSVYLNGTIRSFSPQTRQLLQEELRRACGVVEAMGGSFELTIKEGYPPTVLDPEATQIALDAAAEFLGEENAPQAPMVMAAEDFAYMAQAAPGSFLRLGTHNPDWPQRYYVHTSTFRIDEDALPIGAAALAAAAVKWMQEKRSEKRGVRSVKRVKSECRLPYVKRSYSEAVAHPTTPFAVARVFTLSSLLFTLSFSLTSLVQPNRSRSSLANRCGRMAKPASIG